jgi:ATP-dependent helicase/nuclease subunit B
MRGSKFSSADSLEFHHPNPLPTRGTEVPEGEGGFRESDQPKSHVPTDSDIGIENRTDPYTHYLDSVFAGMAAEQTPLKERAQHFAAHHPVSPADERLLVYAAPNAEAEARAVDIQVRRWLLQGERRIAIISDDRRLARRVRALLERADVALHDAAGWALSTTAAAAAVERWLETMEEDFAYQPLTDLLKSPFAFPQHDREELLAAVYRFEQDLVIHENIPRNLQRYRKHLAYRRARWPQAVGSAVETLLNDVENAAKPMLPLLRTDRAQAPQRWLDALEESMQRLGLTESFATDAAGDRILQELLVMRQSLAGRSIKMRWREFRTWLGRTLERFNFQPPTAASAVRLLGLEQSALAHYDALIIAGASAQHLPGAAQPSPFFNEAVRAELGLPGFQQRYEQRCYYFRRLLQAAPRGLITTHLEESGEPVLVSPWLEALQSFHRFAYDSDLSDDGLAALVEHPATQVIRCDTDTLPQPQGMPAPSVPPALLPDKLSANAYQQVMDCPYQFFAARCLQLTAPEAVREALEKSDYGQRIHLALHAFHSGVEGYPEPYQQVITLANRAAAVARMEEISQAVFAKDLEDNFMHRGWLQRWSQVIPEYIDWQIERESNWRVSATEVALETQRDELNLNGRIDRIDHGAEGSGIVDYKTGATPDKEDVSSGEKVQLPFYALLSGDPVQQVEYLSLDSHRFGSRAVLEGETLHALVAENGSRLHTIMRQLANGASLPAWGDDDTCRYCAMAGVCRREAWSETVSPPNLAPT